MMQSAWTRKKLRAAAIITDERGYVLLVKHSYGEPIRELLGGAGGGLSPPPAPRQ